MIRSRLRRPTSKSITAVFLPRRARPQARLALVVVLPTPPLPEVTTMISAKGLLLVILFGAASVQRSDLDLVLFQPHLHGLAAQGVRDIVQYLVVACNGDQFRMEITAEDACRGVALGPCQRAAAQVP
jgi:hypothetical protein